MSEMASSSLATRACSLGVRSPARRNTKMWVSRLSIPPDSGRKQITLDSDFSSHRPDQSFVASGRDTCHPGKGTPPLQDDDSCRAEVFQNPQAFRLELADAERPWSCPHKSSVTHDQSNNQSSPFDWLFSARG